MGFQDYLPIYYQACKGSSPVGSSVNELPLSIFTGPTAALTAISVPLFQRYRTQLWLGWSLCTLSMGVFTIIHADTPTSISIGLGVPLAVGSGSIYCEKRFLSLGVLR